MLFRRAEELWKSTAKDRQESRRRSIEEPSPTLEQRLAKVREAEAAKRRPQTTPNDQRQRLEGDCGASVDSSTSSSVIPSTAGQVDGAKRVSAGHEGGQRTEQREAPEGRGQNERAQKESTGLDRGSVRARVSELA
jgi:hypothetical protein